MFESDNGCSYIAYIDESGELGSAYDKGSSEFLFMGAEIFPAWIPSLAKTLFEHAREIHPGIAKPCPKFQNCNDRSKHILSSLVAQYPIWTVHIGGDKPALTGKNIGLNKNRLYAYLLKFLLERISWFVRDQNHCHDPANYRCHLVFSKNESLPY